MNTQPQTKSALTLAKEAIVKLMNAHTDIAIAKRNLALDAIQKEKEAPDKYCITLPDGDCVSTDPRCMHQPKLE